MKKEYKDKWVAALRSGEFRQTKSSLRRADEATGPEPGFCCLGVLCQLVAEEANLEPVPGGPGYYTGETYEGDAEVEDEVLPRSVMDLVGLDVNNPSVLIGQSLRVCLSTLNDGDKETSPLNFDEIADLIEAQL